MIVAVVVVVVDIVMIESSSSSCELFLMVDITLSLYIYIYVNMIDSVSCNMQLSSLRASAGAVVIHPSDGTECIGKSYSLCEVRK